MIQVNDAHPPYSQQFIFVLRNISKNKRPWLRKCSLKGLKKRKTFEVGWGNENTHENTLSLLSTFKV